MFIDKIDEVLLDEIQEELDQEYSQIVANWDGELFDIKRNDLDDTLRSEIFSEYLNTLLDMLADLIHQNFPFVKEKDIDIAPYSDVIISETDGYKDVELQVHADVADSDRKKLSEIESKQLDKLLSELTQLYKELEIDTKLTLTHIPFKDVPEDYYVKDEDYGENDYDFVQIEF
ncbi:hypothetical protein [Peribacillus acanthi]|uniref:hypothetical protein n=1 Tax=Peribacillus acanthi TaxID=2171554 RepID=UPI000D3EA32F|nr:hypothetical protein [Peribacillus acanthi]